MADAKATTQELRSILGEVSGLLNTYGRQERAIELWEEVWTRRLPEAADAAANLADAIDEIVAEHRVLSNEQVEEMGTVLRDLAGILHMGSSDNAPNPDLIALYYLRRIDRRVAEIDERLTTVERNL